MKVEKISFPTEKRFRNEKNLILPDFFESLAVFWILFQNSLRKSHQPKNNLFKNIICIQSEHNK